MDESSPFAVLGVPQSIIDEALETGDDHQLKRAVSKLYQALAQVYHPDIEGGDERSFAELADARDEVSSDPLTVAKYYSLREHREARRRRNIMMHETGLGIDEKMSILRLLQNVHPLRVAPWLARQEALIANAVFDGAGKPILVMLTALENRVLIKLARADYDGRRFVYNSQLKSWRVSTSEPETNRPTGYERLRVTGRGRINIIGGMSPIDADSILLSLHKQEDVSSALSLSAGSENETSLSWVPVSRCSWLCKIKPMATRDDFLAVTKGDSDGPGESLISIIGPVLRTRTLKILNKN